MKAMSDQLRGLMPRPGNFCLQCRSALHARTRTEGCSRFWLQQLVKQEANSRQHTRGLSVSWCWNAPGRSV